MLSVWGASDKGMIGCVRVHIINDGCATWVSILSNGNNLLISSLKRTIKVHIDGRLFKFMCAIKSLDVLSHDVYTLIVLNSQKCLKNKIIENRSEPFAGRSTFAKRRRVRDLICVIGVVIHTRIILKFVGGGLKC